MERLPSYSWKIVLQKPNLSRLQAYHSILSLKAGTESCWPSRKKRANAGKCIARAGRRDQKTLLVALIE